MSKSSQYSFIHSISLWFVNLNFIHCCCNIEIFYFYSISFKLFSVCVNSSNHSFFFWWNYFCTLCDACNHEFLKKNEIIAMNEWMKKKSIYRGVHSLMTSIQKLYIRTLSQKVLFKFSALKSYSPKLMDWPQMYFIACYNICYNEWKITNESLNSLKL